LIIASDHIAVCGIERNTGVGEWCVFGLGGDFRDFSKICAVNAVSPVYDVAVFNGIVIIST
jgi:hypothetical protein